METPTKVIKVDCVDCDKEMVYFAQGMIRCEDCLYKFIVEYNNDN
jgi:ribosomal protein S27E